MAEREDASARRTRRRFARRQWRRRWVAWRQIAIGVLVTTILAVAVYGVWFSDWLDVETVEVVGTQTLDADQVRTRADIEVGTPLARVDLDAATARVASIADVREVQVTRSWPDGIVITLEEREAIAVVDIGGRLRGMDAEGVVFGDYRRAPGALPRVVTDVDVDSGALREAALVVSALPDDLVAVLDHLAVESAEEITLILIDGRRAVWGSAEESEVKAEVLAGLLETVEAAVYDVSVPSNPATSG